MAPENGLLLVVKPAGIGGSEVYLAGKLAARFFNVPSQSRDCPARIVLINSSIFLLSGGSPVVEAIERLLDHGTDILSCKACLNYYGKADKLLIGTPTDMGQTANAMLGFEKVVTL